jgi:hypothetical protein
MEHSASKKCERSSVVICVRLIDFHEASSTFSARGGWRATLHPAIERRTTPDALGWKPCPGTRLLPAALVRASRAWQAAHTRGMTLVQ